MVELETNVGDRLALAIQAYPFYHEMRQPIDRLLNAHGFRQATASSERLKSWAVALVWKIVVADEPTLGDIQKKGVRGYCDLADYLDDPASLLSQRYIILPSP